MVPSHSQLLFYVFVPQCYSMYTVYYCTDLFKLWQVVELQYLLISFLVECVLCWHTHRNDSCLRHCAKLLNYCTTLYPCWILYGLLSFLPATLMHFFLILVLLLLIAYHLALFNFQIFRTLIFICYCSVYTKCFQYLVLPIAHLLVFPPMPFPTWNSQFMRFLFSGYSLQQCFSWTCLILFLRVFFSPFCSFFVIFLNFDYKAVHNFLYFFFLSSFSSLGTNYSRH